MNTKLKADFKREILSNIENNVCVPSKRGRRPLNRGKMVIAGRKSETSFWLRKNALEEALDDSFLPNAQAGGNYHKTKEFLKNEWKHKDEFRLSELSKALGEKYPDKADYNGFRLQRWHEASYWENNEIALKPIYKKATYRTYYNIFYIEPD